MAITGRNLVDGIVEIFKDMPRSAKIIFSIGLTIILIVISLFYWKSEAMIEKIDVIKDQVEEVHNTEVSSPLNHLDMDRYIERNKYFIIALDKLLVELGADRVSVFEYHNSLKTIRGTGVEQANHYKMTRMYDRLRPGNTPSSGDYDELLITQWFDLVYQVRNMGFIYLYTDSIDNYVYRNYYKDRGVKSCMIIPLLYKGNIVGHITVEWSYNFYEIINERYKYPIRQRAVVNDWETALKYLKTTSSSFGSLLIQSPLEYSKDE